MSTRRVGINTRTMAAAATAIIGAAATAAAQCNQPPAFVSVESALCSPLVKIEWTNPAGAVFPKVWRSPTPNFADAVLIYNPGLGGGNSMSDVPFPGIVFWYWVGGEILNCPGTPGISQIPKDGPYPGGVFNASTYPRPTATGDCNGVVVRWLPLWDATGPLFVHRASTPMGDGDQFAQITARYLGTVDRSATPGNVNWYRMVLTAPCYSSEVEFRSLPVRVGPWVNAAPVGASVTVGQTATLTVTNPASPTEPVMVPPPVSAVWRRGATVLANSERISGATTTTLQISGVRLEDAGVYTLSMGRACGGTTTVDVVLAVQQACRADFDQSGAAGVQDIFDYLAAWFAGCP